MMRDRACLVLMVAIFALASTACGPAPAQADECLDDPEARVFIGNNQAIPLRPGQSATLRVTCLRYNFMESTVTAPVTWSLEPASAAKLDARTGAVALAANAPVGSRLKVMAELEVRGAKRRLESEIVVIDPQPQPWAGQWRETSRLACAGPGKAGGPDPTPADKAPLIQELILDENGTFSVTWHPFERYKDFWGNYTVDRKTGAVTFTVTGGNSLPPKDADLTGILKLVPGEGLVISDLYFGAPSGSSPPPACGHRFGE